jgi:actin-like ATPase involved in cell morphogenesis
MAEKIEVELGSAWPLEKELESTVRGQDLQSGLPRARDDHRANRCARRSTSLFPKSSPP